MPSDPCGGQRWGGKKVLTQFIFCSAAYSSVFWWVANRLTSLRIPIVNIQINLFPSGGYTWSVTSRSDIIEYLRYLDGFGSKWLVLFRWRTEGYRVVCLYAVCDGLQVLGLFTHFDRPTESGRWREKSAVGISSCLNSFLQNSSWSKWYNSTSRVRNNLFWYRKIWWDLMIH